jgi:hypothetical protein
MTVNCQLDSLSEQIDQAAQQKDTKKVEALSHALGHSRPGPAGRRSSHVRYAPKATVGHQNAIGRDGPITDMKESRNCRASEFAPTSSVSFDLSQ